MPVTRREVLEELARYLIPKARTYGQLGQEYLEHYRVTDSAEFLGRQKEVLEMLEWVEEKLIDETIKKEKPN